MLTDWRRRGAWFTNGRWTTASSRGLTRCLSGVVMEWNENRIVTNVHVRAWYAIEQVTTLGYVQYDSTGDAVNLVGFSLVIQYSICPNLPTSYL